MENNEQLPVSNNFDERLLAKRFPAKRLHPFLLPDQLKNTLVRQCKVVDSKLKRMITIVYRQRHRTRPLRVTELERLRQQYRLLIDSLCNATFVLTDVYVSFCSKKEKKKPTPQLFYSFPDDLDLANLFFVVNRSTFQNQHPNQNQTQNRDTATEFSRHHPQLVELKKQLVNFVRILIGDLQQLNLLNQNVLFGMEEEIFDAATRVLRCLPMFYCAVCRTIEEETTTNSRFKYILSLFNFLKK